MRDKRNAIACYISDLHLLFKQGRFRDEIDLYKYIVNLSPTTESVSEEEEKIREFQDYLAQLKDSFEDQEKFFIKRDAYWTYVEVEFKDALPEYRDLVKIYAPVEYSYLTSMARYLFDYLYEQQKPFCFKIAHSHRLDNLCVWVTKEQFEKVIIFLQSFIDELLPAPLFYPEHFGIGVSRELTSSLNYMIAITLYKYLSQTEQPSLSDYVESVHRQLQQPSEEYDNFDREIVLRSLMCILSSQCPVEESIFNIVNYTSLASREEQVS